MYGEVYRNIEVTLDITCKHVYGDVRRDGEVRLTPILASIGTPDIGYGQCAAIVLDGYMYGPVQHVVDHRGVMEPKHKG